MILIAYGALGALRVSEKKSDYDEFWAALEVHL